MEQIIELVSQGVLQPFCNLLTPNEAKTVLVVLDGLTNILQVCGCVFTCVNAHACVHIFMWIGVDVSFSFMGLSLLVLMVLMGVEILSNS